MKFFDTSVQQLVNDTKLDKDGTPISADEVNLEELNKYFESLGFDMTIPITQEVSDALSVLNKLVLDTDSLVSVRTSKQSPPTRKLIQSRMLYIKCFFLYIFYQ